MGEITFRQEGFIGTITISNVGKKNALTMKMVKEITSLFPKLGQRPDLRCLVLRGEGDGAFCAGYDINAIPSKEEGGEQVLLSANPFDDMIRAVEDVRIPVVAMIGGAVFGGGLELACACDIRIASRGSLFGMTPSRLGVIYRPAGLMRFVNIIGLQFTKELFFTARHVDGERAREIGLVNNLVSSETLKEEVYGIAREISVNAPLSIRGTKRMLNMCMDYVKLAGSDIKEADELIRECMESEDLVEGKRAFREKRDPRFKGR